ncbi:MAG: hypothetical protein V1921_06050 [Candidatus Altiarchaeota archaeon]
MDWRYFIVALLVLGTAGAAKVAVLVDFPDRETFTKCLEADEGANGYEVLELTGLDIDWSSQGEWGHGLCGIEDVGCQSSNCFCGSETYWGFYLAEDDNDWSYSAVGFDGMSGCWNRDSSSYVGHYCARDEDVLGFRWGEFGTLPEYKEFDEICSDDDLEADDDEDEELEWEVEPEHPLAGELIKLDLDVRGVTVKVYSGNYRTKYYEGVSNGEGEVHFSLDEPGTYTVLLDSEKYSDEQFELVIGAQPVTTSTVEDMTTSVILTSVSTSIPTTSTVSTVTPTSTSSIAETSTTVEAPVQKQADSFISRIFKRINNLLATLL